MKIKNQSRQITQGKINDSLKWVTARDRHWDEGTRKRCRWFSKPKVSPQCAKTQRLKMILILLLAKCILGRKKQKTQQKNKKRKEKHIEERGSKTLGQVIYKTITRYLHWETLNSEHQLQHHPYPRPCKSVYVFNSNVPCPCKRKYRNTYS